MNSSGRAGPGRLCRAIAAASVVALAAACAPGGLKQDKGSPWAPGGNHRQQAEDGLVVGHRLMAAGQHELALDAFTRAALDHGLTPEVLTGMGSAKLGLRRLGQAEDLLRQAVDADGTWPEPMNNLGVVLMERGKTAEAVQVFQRAYALDNGESDAIRDNLRLALAKLENPAHTDPQNQDYKLVRQGGGSYLISQAP
ncbi:tetratricopeptide repeat protein [Leisingera sp. HS039]|uniref:tetratricopeptide repeat protein n=1 Tax=unclassified Leisingera TaxID=2614906 RepID=UPI001070F8CB|nr:MULTISPECIES: tetratricopeptide repeat protein [unclassified Leisingera]MBQ4824108.1 tetratricopeptide repeat protein [Leisingera sp. HS039]MCF6431332.1 tetratricopeptide repeat protein [Leisingera sp. MMG026]QBR35520.1 tetratricopeptide repeat protein [Leisingera sp. NJS201]